VIEGTRAKKCEMKCEIFKWVGVAVERHQWHEILVRRYVRHSSLVGTVCQMSWPKKEPFVDLPPITAQHWLDSVALEAECTLLGDSACHAVATPLGTSSGGLKPLLDGHL
jgi:hypothetical protein